MVALATGVVSYERGSPVILHGLHGRENGHPRKVLRTSIKRQVGKILATFGERRPENGSKEETFSQKKNPEITLERPCLAWFRSVMIALFYRVTALQGLHRKEKQCIGVPHSQENAPPYDRTVGLCLVS